MSPESRPQKRPPVRASRPFAGCVGGARRLPGGGSQAAGGGAHRLREGGLAGCGRPLGGAHRLLGPSQAAYAGTAGARCGANSLWKNSTIMNNIFITILLGLCNV